VLSKHGELLHEPVRTPTPYPLRPPQLVAALVKLATGLPSYQRVSAGFPGMVRSGRILSAPHFISPTGPEGKPSADLEQAWTGFELQSALSAAIGRPCRVANDADVQGAALVRGEGLELVITLGTGVGTALFWQGKLAPHLELAHHPLGKGGRTYNEMLGDAVRQKVGNKKWNARVAGTLAILKALVFYDHCYIGGGNSRRLEIDLPPDVTLADNTAGILGGIRLWERT
jgi:polyphosphate glucokinase